MRTYFTKLGIFFLLLISISCTSFHRANTTGAGEFIFNGGYSASKSWDNDLKFTRVSWFATINLTYDALIAKISDESPFYSWFSLDKQQRIKQECDQFLVTLLYSNSPLYISHVQFMKEVRKNGFDDFIIPGFAAAIKSHPDFERLHMKDARVVGFCKKSSQTLKTLKIHMPSYKSAVIQI